MSLNISNEFPTEFFVTTETRRLFLHPSYVFAVSMDSTALFEKLIEAYDATKGFDGFSLESLDFLIIILHNLQILLIGGVHRKEHMSVHLKPEFFRSHSFCE